VAAAQSRAQQRLHRQRETLRPLGWAVILVVVLGSANSHPVPALHGRGLAVTLALCLFGAMLLIAIADGFPERGVAGQTAVIVLMGVAGLALAGLQLKGVTGIAAGVAVFMAVGRLPLTLGVTVGGAVTVALGVATALAGNSSSAVAAQLLVTVLLGLVGQFLKQARESQTRTEMLMAQLEDAREEQTQAAAIAERGRIAGELHDVLAHSLSGAAIQLQGARMLAEREQSGEQMRGAIDRASELVKDGLADARQAVGALRGEELPGVGRLPSLIEDFRRDMDMEVELRVQGSARELQAEASLALYRGAQEALTNVARYAPGSSTVVVISYEPDSAVLTVEDRLPVANAVASALEGLSDVGGGRGLAGMRERVQRAGGTVDAGPTADGWRVELRVPG
jgi:signal transduction histidine kinase